MKKTSFLILLLALLFIIGCAQKPGTNPSGVAITKQAANSPDVTPSPEGASAVSVEVSGFSFNPAAITIKKGTTVTWTNQDSAPHTITSDSGTEIASDTLSKGQSYSHTFNNAGNFNYHCSIHKSMKGTVVVG